MNQSIYIVEATNENDVQKISEEASLLKAQVLFCNKLTHEMIIESNASLDLKPRVCLAISQPHPDLLPAFFNLLNRTSNSEYLIIKSKKLISLIRFYQNLISAYPLKACEIIFNSETQNYYGLLSGEKINFEENDLISTKWVSNETECNYSF